VARSRTPTPEEADVLTVYQDAERALLDRVTGAVRATVDAPDASTSTRAIEGQLQVRRDSTQVLGALDRSARDRVEAAISAAADQGAQEAARQLGRLEFGDTVPAFDRTHRAMLDQIAASVLDRVTPAHGAALRATSDAYRDIVSRVLPRMAVGADTRLSATQRAMWAFADRGITGFTDVAGRRWSLSSYVEMAVRTGSARAAVAAQLEATRAAGSELVIVNGSGDRCEKCRPWHGKVLAIGSSREVRVEHPFIDGQFETTTADATLNEARSAGLLHPQCRCSLSTFTPGVTRRPEPARDNGQYAARQQQRAIERQIRAWKQREAAALDDGARKHARTGVRGAEARMRDHLKANPDLRRLRQREQIGAGNLPDSALRRLVGDGDPLGGPRVQGKARAPRDMGQAELEREMNGALAREDFDAFEKLADESDRRDLKRAADRDRRATVRQAADERRALEIERLLDEGVDELEAVERVTGRSIERQRRDAAIGQLRAEGFRGKSFDELSRESWKAEVYGLYDEAERATNGFMVNAEGVRKGIGESQLLIGSDEQIRRYASRELQEFLDQRGRPTLDEHRAMLLGDQQQASRLRNERGDVFE